MSNLLSEVKESNGIFEYVDSTISSFLKNYIKTFFVGDVNVFPGSPSEIEDSGDVTFGVSVFLYNFSENPFMKNKEKQITYEKIKENEKDEIKEIVKGNPITLDLNYLITPFTKEKNVGNEQILRLLILRAFHEVPVLSGPLLDPKLIKTENYKLNFFLNPMKLEEINHLWTLFGGKTKYRTSISYKVTPVIIRPIITDITSLVRTKEFDYRLKIRENQQGD